MNDNSFLLPSCSDSRRRSRRLTTNINFSRVRHFVPPTTTCTYWHHITLSSLIHIICVVDNLVKLYIIVTISVNLTDIINNGRAPSESDMNGNDNIVIDKPDQRSALDQDCVSSGER